MTLHPYILLFNNAKLNYVRLYGKYVMLRKSMLRSNIATAVHNKAVYLLYYWRHGVT